VDIEDDRLGSLMTYALTLDQDSTLYYDDIDYAPTMVMKSPSRLGIWRRQVLWMGTKSINTVKYDENLQDFCRTYFSPTSQTQ
jgi:hypothetical protein